MIIRVLDGLCVHRDKKIFKDAILGWYRPLHTDAVAAEKLEFEYGLLRHAFCVLLSNAHAKETK